MLCTTGQKHSGAAGAPAAPGPGSLISSNRSGREVVAYSSAQVIRVTTLRPSSVLSTVIVSDPVSPLGTAGRDVGEKKPSDAARDCLRFRFEFFFPFLPDFFFFLSFFCFPATVDVESVCL